MSFLDWTFIVMIVLIGLDLFISPYIEGSPLSLLLTTIIIVLAVINLMGGVSLSIYNIYKKIFKMNKIIKKLLIATALNVNLQRMEIGFVRK